MHNSQHTYILIPGAWMGGWVWTGLVERLRQEGHRATALTLTGLGDRFHNGTPETNLTTHINDVLAHLEMEDLHDVTLVGWSYGGMVISGVATQMPERVRSLIYLDAAFPEPGKAMVNYLPAGAEERLNGLYEQGQPLPPRPLEGFGMTSEAQIAWLTPKIRSQSVLTFLQPLEQVALPDVPISYVHCEGYGAGSNTFTPTWQRVQHDPRVQCLTLDANHFMMLDKPEETLNLLLKLA